MAAARALFSLRGAPAKLVAPRRLGGVRHCHWERPCVDCYVMLGVKRTASVSEIKMGYYAKSKELHPDIADGADSMFGNGYCDIVQLKTCYDALRHHREAYDADNAWRWPAPAEPLAEQEDHWSFGVVRDVDSDDALRQHGDAYDAGNVWRWPAPAESFAEPFAEQGHHRYFCGVRNLISDDHDDDARWTSNAELNESRYFDWIDNESFA